MELGIFHCLNAKTGKVYWTYDLLAACWSSALLVDDKVYLGDEDDCRFSGTRPYRVWR